MKEDTVKQTAMPNTLKNQNGFSVDGDISNVDVAKVLRLAGKLAIAARMVINSNATGLSCAIEYMEGILDEYDSEVMALNK